MTFSACCGECFRGMCAKIYRAASTSLQTGADAPSDATIEEPDVVTVPARHANTTHEEASNLSEWVGAFEAHRIERRPHAVSSDATDATAHSLRRMTGVASQPGCEVTVCFLCSSDALNTTRILDDQTLLVESLREQIDCIICFARERDTLFMPCRHSLACQRCASKLETCPMCRTAIEQSISYFVP